RRLVRQVHQRRCPRLNEREPEEPRPHPLPPANISAGRRRGAHAQGGCISARIAAIFQSARLDIPPGDPAMPSRRDFLAASSVAAAGLALSPLAYSQESKKEGRKKLTVVTTLWNYRSHAWHMAERFLHGYPLRGKWHQPEFDVVSAYVDQSPDGDLSKLRAKEFGFTIEPTVAEALRCGGDKLAVDAVLLIGEHGKYPRNEFNQIQYPRY